MLHDPTEDKTQEEYFFVVDLFNMEKLTKGVSRNAEIMLDICSPCFGELELIFCSLGTMIEFEQKNSIIKSV